MNHLKRLIIAVVVVVSGLAIAPRVALPVEPFSWQRYAMVYQAPQPKVFLPLVRSSATAPGGAPSNTRVFLPAIQQEP